MLDTKYWERVYKALKKCIKRIDKCIKLMENNATMTRSLKEEDKCSG